MNNRTGIGVISFAHGHSNVYCQVLKNFDDAQLISAWDDNLERGQAAAQNHNIKFCTDPDEVLRDPAVDAVIITTETNRHADFVERAAAAGKHILLQKPMATTLADCDRIIAAVHKYGVKFSMGYQMRQDPVNQKIHALIHSGAIGKISIVRRRHYIPVLLDPGFTNGPSRWHMDPIANVGMFFDDAAHATDWFYWMLGQPRSVMAQIDNVVTTVAPDDNGVAIYRFQNGEIGILDNSSTTIAAIGTTEVYGTEGTIIQEHGDLSSTNCPRPKDAVALRMFRKGDAQWTEFDFSIPKSHGERLANVPRPFIDYIRGTSTQTISAEEGRVGVEMLVGAYRSSAEGRLVELPL
ncbi:MAG: Gfo/Idh/MocA family oxidoreductase [Anaerolineaceae bacterium]|nr:Gfo/Idh/MocA family oxidoreductase [Anaerolineaceae bacterium]